MTMIYSTKEINEQNGDTEQPVGRPKFKFHKSFSITDMYLNHIRISQVRW